MLRACVFAVFGLVVLAPALVSAESFEVTSCYSGTFGLFHGSKLLKPVMRWDANGILMDEGKLKKFHNMTFYCEGIQRGLGKTRKGAGYCKWNDPQGDGIVVEINYSGIVNKGTFLEGTGKWKGIKGSYQSKRLASGKSAKPGTYQRCRKVEGSYKLPK